MGCRLDWRDFFLFGVFICDFGFEGVVYDVLRVIIFDGDEVVVRGYGSVSDYVVFRIFSIV